jgi:hypothetical protein
MRLDSTPQAQGLGRKMLDPIATRERLISPRHTLTLRAFLAASNRATHSDDTRIRSAKEASRLHFEICGKFFYLTKAVILDPIRQYEELDEESQLYDPNLILPDGINLEFVIGSLKPATRLSEHPEHGDGAIHTTLPSDLVAELQPPPVHGINSIIYPNGLFSVVSPLDISLQPTYTMEELEDSYKIEDFAEYIKVPDDMESVASEEPGDTIMAPGHDEHSVIGYSEDPKFEELLGDSEGGGG